MPSYSDELKAQIVKKMMPPYSQPVSVLSVQTGVSVTALYRWKNQYRAKEFVVPSKKSLPERWDAKSKLAAVIQTAPMNKAERSTYGREHGLYPQQLDAWKAAFESLDMAQALASKSLLAAATKKNKLLEKELLQKDRALAETAVLLTLSKIAQAIWGVSEED